MKPTRTTNPIVNPGTTAMPSPLALNIERACDLTGLSRSTLYRLAGSKAIRMVKAGRCTLIPYDSLSSYMSGLEDAAIRPQA